MCICVRIFFKFRKRKKKYRWNDHSNFAAMMCIIVICTVVYMYAVLWKTIVSIILCQENSVCFKKSHFQIFFSNFFPIYSNKSIIFFPLIPAHFTQWPKRLLHFHSVIFFYSIFYLKINIAHEGNFISIFIVHTNSYEF